MLYRETLSATFGQANMHIIRCLECVYTQQRDGAGKLKTCFLCKIQIAYVTFLAYSYYFIQLLNQVCDVVNKQTFDRIQIKHSVRT